VNSGVAFGGFAGGAGFAEQDVNDKSPDAYRTISEVAEDLDLPQHVLRFWETRFPQIKPLKRGGGRRYYRPDDVALIIGLKTLLYGQGFTIKGVQRILKEQGVRHVQAIGRGQASAPVAGAGGQGSTSVATAMQPAPVVPVQAPSNATAPPGMRTPAPLMVAMPQLAEYAMRAHIEAALSELSAARRALQRVLTAEA
jgi:DNA-binding transcriptional MerR regulator